jgi:hypothetical protein
MNIIEIIEEEYHDIIKEYEKLGSGGYGKVFEKDGFAFKVTTDMDEAKYALKIKNNQSNVSTFPIIYSVKPNKDSSFYIIKRELVDMLKPTEKAYVQANNFKLMKYVNFGHEESLEYLKNSRLSSKFIDFIIRLRQDYLKIGKKSDNLDIHAGNIGINSNGNFVLFDF